MRTRILVALLPLVVSPIVGSLLAPHAAFASSSLGYEIQASSGLTENFFDVNGPTGTNVGKPVFGDAGCAGHFADTFEGWTVSGIAFTRNYASVTAAEADTRAPAFVAVKFTDGAGDVMSVVGLGVFDNNQDSMVSGSYKITFSGAGGSASCTISNVGAQSSGEAEME
jgi:hypothetical protein